MVLIYTCEAKVSRICRETACPVNPSNQKLMTRVLICFPTGLKIQGACKLDGCYDSGAMRFEDVVDSRNPGSGSHMLFKQVFTCKSVFQLYLRLVQLLWGRGGQGPEVDKSNPDVEEKRKRSKPLRFFFYPFFLSFSFSFLKSETQCRRARVPLTRE